MSNSTVPHRPRAPKAARRTVIVAVTVLAALVAGCSGSDAVETASMRSQARPGSGAADPGGSGGQGGSDQPGEPGGGGGGGSEGTTPGGGSGGSGGGGGDPEEFCRQLNTFTNQGDPDDIEVVLEWLRDLRDAAPEELREDFEVMTGMIERLESVDENDPEAISEVFEALLDPAVQEASENVARYASEECGVDLNGEIDLQPGTPGG